MYRIIFLLLVSATTFGDVYLNKKIQGIEKINLQEAMTPREFANTGLNRLTPQELRTLQTWMNDHIKEEFEKSFSNVMEIQEILKGGGKVSLSDGSIWNVAAHHRSVTRKWAAGHQVELEATRRPSGTYRLHNLTTSQFIDVKKDLARAEKQTPGLQMIESINRSGSHVTLEDGSVYKVSLFDKQTTRKWQPTDEVEIRGQALRGGRVRLYNKSSRDSVEAILLFEARKPKSEEEEDK